MVAVEVAADAGVAPAAASASVPRGPGRSAALGGTRRSRNAAAGNTVEWQRVRSNPVGRTDDRHNRQDLSLGAGPRTPPAAPAAALLPAAWSARDSAGFVPAAAPDLPRSAGNVCPTASAATAGPAAGKRRCNSDPGAGRGERSVRSPSANTAGGERSLDVARTWWQTEVGPRELRTPEGQASKEMLSPARRFIALASHSA